MSEFNWLDDVGFDDWTIPKVNGKAPVFQALSGNFNDVDWAYDYAGKIGGDIQSAHDWAYRCERTIRKKNLPKKDADLLDKVRTLMNDEHIRKLHDTLNEIQDDLDELISQDYIENHD